MMYVLFVLLGFSSSLLSSVFGFGSAMIVLGIGPYLLPVHQVIPLSAALFAASTLTKSVVFRPHIHWKIVCYITAGSLPFAYLGGLLLPLLSPQTVQRCLGILILAYIVLTTPEISATWRNMRYRLSRSATTPGDTVAPPVITATVATTATTAAQYGKTRLITIAAGYGLTSGLVGSGSIIKVIYFRQLGFGKEAFVGTMAATSLAASAGKITAYTQTGMLHSGLTAPILALTITAVCAVLIGQLILHRINSELFNHGITLLLFIAALGLLL